MNEEESQSRRFTKEGVIEDFQRQPHLLLRLAENSLTVAQSLRDNYFKNTATFLAHLRRATEQASTGKRREPLISIAHVKNAEWSSVQGEIVTFIDGGIGQVELSNQVPILLRVGSYCVRTGERILSERENFGYYPVILGDLEGGSKERRDFPDIVRITAELLGGLSALERTQDLRVLMLHGPLMYLMSAYAGHTPFTEEDIDVFLRQYASDPELGNSLKESFLKEARIDAYPRMTDRWQELVDRRLFEPLSWIAFLYRRLLQVASSRIPKPIIVGVVERSNLRQFSEDVLLERVFRGLRSKNNTEYFNNMYGRTDLSSPKSLLDRLGYTDTLLIGMLLQPGEYSEPWIIDKVGGLRTGNVYMPGESWATQIDFAPLQQSDIGFPKITGCYLHVSENTEPLRVEVFQDLAEEQLDEAVRRVFLYSKLLPGYGFPVGLDIADKFAHVPQWMTDAYGKMIRHHLGVSLQSGDISDAETRRLIVQAIYMTHRDWLFRPSV